jgi:hypothetical protein
MKPSAYISDGGILFKESPPDSILKLNPLYTSAEIQALHNLVEEQDKKIINLAFDLEYARRTDEFVKRELTDEEILLVSKTVPIDADTYDLQEFARAILQKASEK